MRGRGRGRGHGPPIVLGSLIIHNPHNPPHKRLLVRLGQAVCRSSSGWVVSFPCHCRHSPLFHCPPRCFVALPIVLFPSLLFRVPCHFVFLPVILCPSPSFCVPPHHFVSPIVLFLSSPLFRCPHDPPCEQVARRQGAGAVPSLLLSFLSVA